MKKLLIVGALTLSMIPMMVGCTSTKDVADQGPESTPPLVEAPLDETETPAESPSDETETPEEAPVNGSEPAVEVETKKGDGITYEIHTLAYLEEDLQTALNFIQEHRGFGIMKEDKDGYFIYIGSGEKSTSGYGLDIENVVKKDGKLKIVVKESKPGKDDMLAQVISYPTRVIKINEKIQDIEVVNLEGDVFEDINDERGEK